MVDSVADLLDLPRSWVLKAPLSASGRNRYIEKGGPGLADPKTRRTVARLFEIHGPLLLEPWMDRTADFGVSAILTHEELRIVGIHGQRVDRKGQFAGIDLEPDLTDSEKTVLRETTEAVAAKLRTAGYAPPIRSQQAIGYAELHDVAGGSLERGRAIELIKRNSRHYARRQISWYRPDQTITWYASPADVDLAELERYLAGL